MPDTTKEIQQAVLLIKAGKTVAFPTETVYGLGADAFNDKAVAEIFVIKGRPQFNPLILHFADMAVAEETVYFNDTARLLAQRFWAGPLTFVLPRKNKKISYLVSAGLETLAVRMPSHPIAKQFLQAVQVPIAAPSANISGTVSPTASAHVKDAFKNKVFVLEGGSSAVGLESTVLDLTSDNPVILRAGFITPEDISKVLDREVTISKGNPDAPHSPGQLLSHYAPILPVRINAAAKLYDNEAFIGFGKGYPFADLNLSKAGDLKEAAANLFSYLHILDDKEKYRSIAIAPIPEQGIGLAINDRIRRAAYPR